MHSEAQDRLNREIESLRQRLEVAEEMRRAIIDEELDGFVVGKNGGGPRLVLLDTAFAAHGLLLQRMDQGAVTVAKDGSVLYANQRFASMVGRSLAELFDAALHDFAAERDRPQLDAFVSAGAPDSSIEVVLEGRDGVLHARLTTASAGEGHVSLLVTDLSARDRFAEAENVLKAIHDGQIDGVIVAGEQVVLTSEAQESYRLIVDQMEQGAVTISREGDVLYANDRFAAMLGVPRDELLGTSLLTLLGGQRSMIDGPVASRTAHESWIVRPDGTRLPVGVAAQPVSRADAVTLVFTDLTERKRHEAIEEQVERKDQFLAVLSHELRNPLASIRNAAEALQRSSGLRDDVRQSVQIIGRQTATLARLVDDLLDLRRLSEGKVVLAPQPVELGAIIRNAIEAAQPFVEGRHHVLDVSLPDEPVYVNGDAVRLVQVLLNVLSNAAKFTSDGGLIRLSLERAGSGKARIGVADNGIGIPAELLGTIFEPYVQVTPSEEMRAAGLGLGLSVARRLIELHGGSIRAYSEGLGRGTTFVLDLPTCAAPAAPSGIVAPSADLKRKRVLVIDDSIDSATSLADLLRIMGHDTRMANDGIEALAIAEQFRPDVALLDIEMPHMDGYATARALRERPWACDMTVFALTGWGQPDDRRRTTEAGFDGHFVKPVDPDEICRAIADVRTTSTPSA